MNSFDDLKNYITQNMRMSHIYQPVFIKTLLSNQGVAGVNEIAKAIASHDPSQVEYYEMITKRMPAPVLCNNGIIDIVKSGNKIEGYKLSLIKDLSERETSELITLCETKLNEFLDNRQQDIWSHRRKSRAAMVIPPYFKGIQK